MRTFRYLDLITASFVAVLLISNIASTKILDLKWFTFDGGTILFPLAYIFGDILTEVYGYARSRRVIWTGFIWIAVAAGIFYLVDRLPAASEYEMSDSFHAILGQNPRIVAGSLAAYFVGEFVNSVILAKLKVWSAGRMLWARTISSTLFGQGVDTAIFLLIAFGGVFTNATLWEIFKSNYVFKVGVEVAFTPITYLVVRYLKRVECSDVYDRDTDFSPFQLSTSQAPAD
jgi:queuosine precursor transporter